MYTQLRKDQNLIIHLLCCYRTMDYPVVVTPPIICHIVFQYMARNIFQRFSIYADNALQIIFHNFFVFWGIFQKDILLPIYPVPITGIFCPKHMLGLIDKVVYDAMINMNRVPHKVSGGVRQGKHLLTVLVFSISQYIRESCGKHHQLKVWCLFFWHYRLFIQPLHFHTIILTKIFFNQVCSLSLILSLLEPL